MDVPTTFQQIIQRKVIVMKCIHCGKEVHSVNYVTENDEPLCDECYIENYTTCKICGKIILRGTGTLCSNCSDIAFKKIINSYGTKIGNRFKNRKSDTLVMKWNTRTQLELMQG